MRFLPIPETAPAIGAAIATYMRNRGISQAYVARQIGLSPVELNRLLRGSSGRRQITAAEVRDIADVLDVNRDTRLAWLAAAQPTEERRAS